LTKSILSSNRAFALIQSILSRSLRKGGQSCGPYHDRHGLVADDSSLTSIENRESGAAGRNGESGAPANQRSLVELNVAVYVLLPSPDRGNQYLPIHHRADDVVKNVPRLVDVNVLGRHISRCDLQPILIKMDGAKNTPD